MVQQKINQNMSLYFLFRLNVGREGKKVNFGKRNPFQNCGNMSNHAKMAK